MSPEERELLNRSVALAEENNQILRSMKRGQRWASIMRTVYWVFIIGSAVGAFYLLQPYIDSVKGLYQDVSNGLNSLKQ
ncbi:hypothetical protein HYZ82_02910 [Candidatus Nomurabacteria bacterium]|nr:hypothetical protein [Candidatus Nomurabacteria bacterium]